MRFSVVSAVAFAGIASAFTPAYPYNANNSSQNASTTLRLSTNTSPNKASSSTISLKSTNAPPKVCGVNTVTVYETAYAPKSYATVTKTAIGSKASSTAKVGKPFGYSEEQFRPQNEGDMKLQPCNHWSHDAKDPKNLIPTAVGEKTQLYYAEDGKPQPSKTFYFGIIDLLFKAPAVVLEKSSWISNAAYFNNQLVIDFTSALACDFAKSSWTKGTIIVSSSAGCKKSSDDDQCYFEVDSIVKSGTTVTVSGKPQSQNDCTEGGEANWGMYRPSVSNGGSHVSQPERNGTAGSNGTTGSNGSSGSTGYFPGAGNSTVGGGFLDTNSTGNGTNKFGDDMSTCHAPVDTKYGLPTACLGEYFDLDLDEALGYGELSADDAAFLKEAMSGMDDDTLTRVTRRAVLHRRTVERRFLKKFIKFVAKKIVAPAVSVLKTAVNVAVTVAKGAVQLITTGTISGSIRESFSFTLPNGAQTEAKQVESPWGAAILIAAYGTNAGPQSSKGLQKDGYLNIYCVGCGAQGRVELAGRATWSITQGITQGELEAWADLKAALKIGVDAQIQLSKEWNKNLFQIGLPGLSFGVITIGPQVRLESRVTLEASAKGRLLAGAELSWNRAYAKVDLVNPANSRRENFDPVFTPTFEAEGEIFVGAELGLPIGLHFGISITSWKKTVALINEPMIKGIAKAAAKAELANGQFTAGFTATEGCIGIHTNLSWRNRLYGDVLGIKQFDIMDTGYKSIKSACIAIGRQSQTPAVGGDSTTNPSTPAEGGSSTNPSTPSQGGGQQTGPSTPADDDDQPAAPQTPSNSGAAQPATPQTPTDGNATPSTPPTPASDNDTPSSPANDSDQPQTPSSNDAPTPPSSDSSATPEKRTLSPRQSNSTAPTNSTNDLRDLTDSIKPSSSLVSYPIPDIPTSPYTRADGYEFTKLLAEDGTYNLFYCSNGNMYVKKTAQATGLGCDELFVLSDDAVAGDGAGRYFSFHRESMARAGVSRLRLGDEEHPVKGTGALALVPWRAAELGEEMDTDIEGLYIAADYETEAVYWLAFCSYEDGQAPKVFVVADMDVGLGVLESGDVAYSVTGGRVDKCWALSAREDPSRQDQWAEWDDSEETRPGGLEIEEEEV